MAAQSARRRGPDELDSEATKACPFCKEEVHPDAVKCRWCQSMLLPPQPAAADSDRPAADAGVTYVVDRGLVRFAKFAGGIVAVILAAGLYLVGFDLRRTMQTLQTTRLQLSEAEGQLGKAKEELDQVSSELDHTRDLAHQAEEELETFRRGNTEEMERFRSELTAAQRELSGTRRQFADSRAEIEGLVRTSRAQPGSWSYLGTDALYIPQNQPTMNFGWLDENTSPDELKRVVLGEFSHMLGLINEHQNPNATIPWDEEKVYRYYELTNGWDRERVFSVILRRYEGRYREFDPASIMQEPIPDELTRGDYSIGRNTELSASDKRFIAELYPAG